MVDEEVSTIWAGVGFVASFSRFHLASHLQQGLYRQPGGVVTLRSLLQSERIIQGGFFNWASPEYVKC